MHNSVSTVIDPESCIGCGLCVEVCPAQTLSMQEGKAVVSGAYSMACGHCEAVCPVQAIRVEALEHPFSLSSAATDDRWLPYGEFDTVELVRLMRSRRSCRNYKDKKVERRILEDLAKIGTTAPSGTNSQLWSFTILVSREEVVILGELVARFFQKLNSMAGKPWLRLLFKVFGGDGLGTYYRRYYDTVREGLLRWELAGEDPLFHGATAVIIVGGSKSAGTPMEDAMLASQNILLAAHSLGLGSCMIGFAVEAICRDRRIRQVLKIPENESVFAVIGLGYPAEKYHKTAHRKRITPRYPTLLKK